MQQLKERGNGFLKRNKLDRALEMYTEALKVVPDNANLRKQIQITLREVCVVHELLEFALLRFFLWSVKVHGKLELFKVSFCVTLCNTCLELYKSFEMSNELASYSETN